MNINLQNQKFISQLNTGFYGFQVAKAKKNLSLKKSGK